MIMTAKCSKLANAIVYGRRDGLKPTKDTKNEASQSQIPMIFTLTVTVPGISFIAQSIRKFHHRIQIQSRQNLTSSLGLFMYWMSIISQSQSQSQTWKGKRENSWRHVADRPEDQPIGNGMN